MEWIGHSSIAMTMRYAHLAPQTNNRMISVLDDAPAEEGRAGRPRGSVEEPWLHHGQQVDVPLLEPRRVERLDIIDSILPVALSASENFNRRDWLPLLFR